MEITVRFAVLAAAMLLFACAGGDDTPTSARGAADYLDHETLADLTEPVVTKTGATSGIPSSFDQDRVMDDAFFGAADAVEVGQVQAFLERTPYGSRCFLADERVGGVSAAEAIVSASKTQRINPIVMLARMQVEKSIIAKTSRPSSQTVDYAFGCGCPDGRACNSAYRGLDKQIECAAGVLRRHYDASVAGDGIWNKGVAKRTLDPITVTPRSHATASLYAYTPWVLRGRGGNWLVWNITLRFAQHFASVGTVNLPETGGAPPARDGWIGDACDTADTCNFDNGRCEAAGTRGVCTRICEGFCPDKAGRATTFCVDAVALNGDAAGLCTVYAGPENGQCEALGMEAAELPRYVGGSGAPARTARVCVYKATAGPPPSANLGGCAPGLDAAGTCDGQSVVRCVEGEAIETDCGRYDGVCDEDASGAHCIARASPVQPGGAAACPAGIDTAGRCEGDVVATCEGGTVSRFDCATLGALCAESAAGARCVAAPVAAILLSAALLVL